MYFKNIFLLLIVTTVANSKTYEGYKVFNIIPKNIEAVHLVNDIQNVGIGELWEEHVDVNIVNKIMVAGDKEKVFLDEVKKADVDVVEVISDLQKLIDEQRKPSTSRNRVSFLSYDWNSYHDLDAIYNWMDEIVNAYPDIASPINIGKTVENRDIKGIVINYNPDTKKQIAVIEGTIHAREWISAATVTWIIKEFLTSTDSRVRSMAENIEWHFIPVLNPDGYVYTFENTRMWRKNRSKVSSTICSTADDDMSNGVDLNRNFAVAWMTGMASDNPCNNTFAGPSPFSEPESQALAQYVTSLKERGEILYYFAFHSYSQLIIVPYSHLESTADPEIPSNYGDMFEISSKAAEVLAQRYGTIYRPGLSADLMYPMSGTSFDWVKLYANASISLLFELRDLGDEGFLLLPHHIIPNNLEIMDAMIEIDRVTRELGYYNSSAVNAVGLSIVLMFGVVFALLY